MADQVLQCVDIQLGQLLGFGGSHTFEHGNRGGQFGHGSHLLLKDSYIINKFPLQRNGNFKGVWNSDERILTFPR